ncbi:hypothetical protein ACET3Z_016044 [Daucus carota]
MLSERQRRSSPCYINTQQSTTPTPSQSNQSYSPIHKQIDPTLIFTFYFSLIKDTTQRWQMQLKLTWKAKNM